jgi:hypothetical protein
MATGTSSSIWKTVNKVGAGEWQSNPMGTCPRFLTLH